MIYIKRAVSADVNRQIDLSFEVAEIFFGYDRSKPGLVLNVDFIERHSKAVYQGNIKKSGHGVTIPGQFFSYIKANHKIDDLIVFEKTDNPKLFLFQVLRPTDRQYSDFEDLLKKYGKYSSVIKKHTHLLIDETTIPEGRWMKVISDWIEKIEALEGKEEKLSESVVRELHDEWKKLLAQNMMNIVNKGSDVVCPFTGVEGDFSKLPMLFIASHIKRFADSSLKEKYDINNGLLLTANADALFDKYMVTVSEDKKLVFSKFIDEDLKRVLNLVEIIMPEVLNDERMEYMKEHRRIFEEKEKLRTTSGKYEGEETESVVVSTDAPTTQVLSLHKPQPRKYELPSEEHPLLQVADPEETFCLTSNTDVGLKYKFSPNVTRVIIGCYKNADHMRWIAKNKKYNIRVGKRVGSLSEMAEDLPMVQLLILYSNNSFNKKQFYTIAESQGQKMDVEQMKTLGYSTTRTEGVYFVYDLEYEHEPIDLDIEKIVENAKKNTPRYKKGMPIIIEINNN